MTKVPPSRFPGGPPRPATPVRGRATDRARPKGKAAQFDPYEVVEMVEGQENASGHEDVEREKDQQERAAEAFQQDSAGDSMKDVEEKLRRDEQHIEEKAKEEGEAADGPATSQKDPPKARPATAAAAATATPKASDGFENKLQANSLQTAAAQMEKLSPSTPAHAPAPRGTFGGILTALNEGREAGGYIKSYERDPAEEENDEDRELLAAVVEAQRLLEGIKGIQSIGPGRNDAMEPVVLISIERGFSQPSVELIPPKVQRFDTLTAIPYDLLPLRRQ